MNAEPTTGTAPWPHMQVPAQRSAPPTPPPPPVVKPVKARRRWPWAVGGLALGLLIGSVSGAAGSSTATVTAAAAAPARTVTVTAPAPPPETITVTVPAPPPVQADPPAAAAPSGPLTTFGDGVWEVGVDVAAGKYKTAGPGSDGIGMCYHARLKNNDGSLGDIIDNNISQGPVTVTIKPGDGYFETNGCQDWVKVG